MNRYLEPGQTLRFPVHALTFEIRKIIGRGASSVVYQAVAPDGTEHLLKEYNPKLLDLSRDEAGNLSVDSVKDEEVYAAGLQRFENGFYRQTQIRRYTELRNVTTNTQGYYAANQTAYIDMTYFSGVTLEKYEFRSLYDIARCFRAISRVIGNYHDKGFLHLDIKPENIFVLPETPEMVMLFDFDSVTHKNDLQVGSALSYTKSWAAPEQILPGKRSKICEATDLYAIGEMLFWFLFGRHSRSDERRSFSGFTFDGTQAFMQGLEVKALSLLRDIFRHTISNKIENRFGSAEELELRFLELVHETDPDRPQPVDTIPSVQPFFIGRDAEFREMDAQLQPGGNLFVCGVGGIGKTELTKQFIRRYRERFRHVQYTVCADDLIQTIADDRMIQIRNFILQPDESLQDYYDRKMRKLSELLTAEDLLVLDNLASLEDEKLSEVLSLPCMVLATTRMHAGEFGLPEYEVAPIQETEDVRRLFLQYYTKPLTPEQSATVDEIIERLDAHTMAVELFAKQMMRGRIDPIDMLKRLEIGGLDETGREAVLSSKDSKVTRGSAYDHIRMMFDLSGLDASSLTVLENLALIPKTGIDTVRFAQWCGLDNYDTINELILSGWVREDAQADRISMHPIIADLAIERMGGRIDDCASMLRSITEYLGSDTFDTATAQEKTEVIPIVSGIASVLIREHFADAETAAFLDRAATACRGFGYLDSVRVWLETTLRIRTELDGAQTEKVADSLHHLAGFHREQGQLDTAQRLYLQALEIRRDLFGENHRATAESYESLGNLYAEKGDFEEAERHLQLSLDIRLQCDPKSEADIAHSYMSFAYFYYAKGLLDLAVQNEQKVLDCRLHLFGEKHRLTAEAYSDYGFFCAEQGHLDIAEQYYLKSLEVYRYIFADGHHDTAIVCNNLCNLLQKKGQAKEALQYGERARQILEKLYSKDHIALLEIDGNLGGAYQMLGQFDLAERCFQHAQTVCALTYGNNGSRSADCMISLGNLYLEMCKLDLAEAYYLQANDILNKIPERLKDLSLSYNRLGDLYYEKEMPDLAEKYCLKALEIREQLSQGKYSRDLAASYHNIAMIYQETNDLEKAKRFLLKAYSMFSKLTPGIHKENAIVLRHLGECYLYNRDFRKADACIRRVYEYYQKNHKEDSAGMAFSCTSLGKLALFREDYATAVKYIRRSMDIRRRLYGEDHAGIASNLYTLGTIYAKTGNANQAVSCLEQSCSMYVRLFGESHADAQAAKALLLQLLQK